MKILCQFSILLFLTSLAICEDANFIDCGSGNVKAMRVTPCDKPEQCSLLVNSFVELEIDFVSNVDSDVADERIKGIVRGKELPFPGEKRIPCSGLLTPGCPIKKDQKYMFKAKFEIKQYYPAISIHLIYSLLDKNGDPIFCVKIPTIIVSNAPKKPRRGG